MVDVAAHHAIGAAPPRLARDRDLEVRHIADRALDLELQVLRQAPVREAQPRTRLVEPAVDLECQLVGHVAGIGQPLRTLDDPVEEVAVGDPQAPAIGGDMDAIVHDVDATEVVTDVAACELVVVAGHEDHARALARLAQQLLHDVVVGLRPVPAAPQLPSVDDVAHEVQGLAARGAQELQQRACLTSGRAQVQVGDPHRAHVEPCRRILIHHGDRVDALQHHRQPR